MSLPGQATKWWWPCRVAAGTSGDLCSTCWTAYPMSVHIHYHLSICPSIYLCHSLSQSFSFSPSLNLSQSLFSPTPSAFLNPEISLPSPSSISLSASLSTPSPLLHSISYLPFPIPSLCVCVCPYFSLSSPFSHLLSLPLCLCSLCPPPPFLSLHSPLLLPTSPQRSLPLPQGGVQSR